MIFKNWPYKFNIFFVFVGDGPSQYPPRHGYETIHARRERIEITSVVEEHLVNEDMEMDGLLKTWKTQKKTKRN
jgi:hypothetical protein